MRAITGTQAQMNAAQTLLDALLELPNATRKTATWSAPELLEDGVTWALRVPIKGPLATIRQRIAAIGLSAVVDDIQARTGRTISKTQAQTVMDAIRDATERRSKAEADAIALEAGTTPAAAPVMMKAAPRERGTGDPSAPWWVWALALLVLLWIAYWLGLMLWRR